MFLSMSQLRASSKNLVAAVVAAGSLFQIQMVHDTLITMAHDHPHVIGGDRHRYSRWCDLAQPAGAGCVGDQAHG